MTNAQTQMDRAIFSSCRHLAPVLMIPANSNVSVLTCYEVVTFVVVAE